MIEIYVREEERTLGVEGQRPHLYMKVAERDFEDLDFEWLTN